MTQGFSMEDEFGSPQLCNHVQRGWARRDHQKPNAVAKKRGIKPLSNVIWVVIDRVHKRKQKACWSVAVRSGKQEVSKMAQISSPYEKP